MLKVCAEALLGGSKAAVSRAGDVSGVNAKQRVLASAGQTLLAVRQYELAADLFEAAAVGSPNPAMVANRRRLRFDCAPAWDRNGVRQSCAKTE